MFREFRIGNGKIIQGDCLEVLKTLSENEIVLAFTSPPYLNAINYEEHVEKINGKKERWERKDISYDEYKQFLVDRFRELLRVVRPGGFNVVNISPILWNGERTPYQFELTNSYDIYFSNRGADAINSSKIHVKSNHE